MTYRLRIILEADGVEVASKSHHFIRPESQDDKFDVIDQTASILEGCLELVGITDDDIDAYVCDDDES